MAIFPLPSAQYDTNTTPIDHFHTARQPVTIPIGQRYSNKSSHISSPFGAISSTMENNGILIEYRCRNVSGSVKTAIPSTVYEVLLGKIGK